MSGLAIFFNWWPNVPTYHCFNNDRLNKREDGFSADYTQCGRLVSKYVYETQRFTEPGTILPLKHAVKFGRPCKLCFVAEKDTP